MGIKPFVSNPFGSWVSNPLYQTLCIKPFVSNLLYQTLLVHGYQTLCIKPFWFMGIKKSLKKGRYKNG